MQQFRVFNAGGDFVRLLSLSDPEMLSASLSEGETSEAVPLGEVVEIQSGGAVQPLPPVTFVTSHPNA